MDLGCALDCAGFEYDGEVRVSLQEEGLIFFLLRLMARMDALGPAPAVDFMRYVRMLESFR